VNSQLNSLRDWNRQRFSGVCQSFEGAEAIYAERPLILHVRVTQVSFDDWGVKATITDLLSPGMHRVRQNPFEIASAWEIFSFSESDWDTPNIPECRNRTFFHPMVLHPALERAAEANRNGATIDWDEFLAVVRPYYQMKQEELSRRLQDKLKSSQLSSQSNE
jgi:hypothetical protein